LVGINRLLNLLTKRNKLTLKRCDFFLLETCWLVSEVAKPDPVPPPQVPEEVVDENDSLSEILRNPLHDTHEFKLGCTDCVLRTGSRVVDFRYVVVFPFQILLALFSEWSQLSDNYSI